MLVAMPASMLMYVYTLDVSTSLSLGLKELINYSDTNWYSNIVNTLTLSWRAVTAWLNWFLCQFLSVQKCELKKKSKTKAQLEDANDFEEKEISKFDEKQPTAS